MTGSLSASRSGDDISVNTRRKILKWGNLLALAALPFAGPGEALTRAGGSKKSILKIDKENAVFGASSEAFDKWGYSPAVRAGDLLFIAGVVGVRPDGTTPSGIAEQAELAFARIDEILRLEGLDSSDLVEVVSYLVRLEDNLPGFLPVKEKHFVQPFPAWTLLGVEALGLPELLVEIKCIAALRN